jgi:hypothetical protein
MIDDIAVTIDAKAEPANSDVPRWPRMTTFTISFAVRAKTTSVCGQAASTTRRLRPV